MAWTTLAELFQTKSAPLEGKTSSAVQPNLPPGLTTWHTHGPGLQGKDIQGGPIRERAVEKEGGRSREGIGTKEQREQKYPDEDIRLVLNY